MQSLRRCRRLRTGTAIPRSRSDLLSRDLSYSAITDNTVNEGSLMDVDGDACYARLRAMERFGVVDKMLGV